MKTQGNKIIRKPDSDLQSLFKMGHGGELKITDIHTLLACVPGEADSFNWHWIVALCNGTFAYITGGCDYSGWGCQDWGEVVITDTARDAAQLGQNTLYYPEKKSIREQLVDQLHGIQPYGLREE